MPALLAGAVVLVWAVHSRFLFSWDSANFAFGVSRIDIAAHRPHPPGYLGYVLAARGLAYFVGRPNLAFIVTNLVGLLAAALLTARLAQGGAPRSWRSAIAVALFAFSPLVLFYSAVAEIYVWETACAVAIACAAHEAAHGSTRALGWCAAAAGAAAIVKPPTVVLMSPVVAYAFIRAPRGSRTGPLLALLFALSAVAAVFLLVEPHLVQLVASQFVTATSETRVFGAATSAGVALNRNLRDTFVALLAALGVSSAALAAWAGFDRKLPAPVDRTLLILWVAPYLYEVLVIHLGKPGYVLPLLPVACVVLAGWYERLGPRRAAALTALAAATNTAWFLFASPPRPNPADTRRYRDKPFVDRMASDLQGLTFPTRATIVDSDAEVSALTAAARTCEGAGWVLVAGSSHVNWRRAMYYLPAAVAIDVDDRGRYLFIGRNGTFAPIGIGRPIESDCGLLWLADAKPAVETTFAPREVPGVGWIYPAGRGVTTTTAVTWEPVPRLARLASPVPSR